MVHQQSRGLGEGGAPSPLPPPQAPCRGGSELGHGKPLQILHSSAQCPEVPLTYFIDMRWYRYGLYTGIPWFLVDSQL